jgi:hypothetical protein
MKPEDAEKPENECDVKTNLEINAIHRRKYPVIEVGDQVRTFRKKKAGDKERMGNFAEGNKTVMGITKSRGETFYKLTGESIPFIRADLHLIKKRTEEKAKEVVPAAVTAERNIIIDDVPREDTEEDKKAKEEWFLIKNSTTCSTQRCLLMIKMPF